MPLLQLHSRVRLIAAVSFEGSQHSKFHEIDLMLPIEVQLLVSLCIFHYGH